MMLPTQDKKTIASKFDSMTQCDFEEPESNASTIYDAKEGEQKINDTIEPPSTRNIIVFTDAFEREDEAKRFNC